MVSPSQILSSDYVALHRYLGEVKFNNLISEYISNKSHDCVNSRWLSNHLPDFIRSYFGFAHFPEIPELASLERAFNTAFGAVEARTWNNDNKTSMSDKTLKAHPSVSLLKFTQNTTSIWSALKCEEKPPKPHQLDDMQNVIVWRQGNAPRFRILGEEEAKALKRVINGVSYKALCNTLKTNAETYLRGWIEAELILATA
jgi:hypothetical protein